MLLILAGIVALILFLIPNTAFAWGPATHIVYANEVLGNLSLFSPYLQQLLTQYRDDFLYGNIAADITLGKKYIEYEHHCHNWRVGFEILQKADKDFLKAFSYGYLAHLAADVVSHNYFIPFKTAASFNTSTIHRHTYWEIRFDAAMATKETWKMAMHIAKERYHKGCDEHLDKILHHTLFTFKTNRSIFHGLLVIQNILGYQKTIQRAHKVSRAGLPEEETGKFSNLSYEAIKNFLLDGENAAICKIDPSGEKNIKRARILRRELKRMARSTSGEREAEEKLKKFYKELLDQFSPIKP